MTVGLDGPDPRRNQAGQTLDGALEGASVVVCCGSGGVGKTTTAAVLGIEAARRGRRAVVVTIDPARRLADALGIPDGLGAEPRRVPLGRVPLGRVPLGRVPLDLENPAGTGSGELWAMMLDTEAMFDQVVRAHAGTDEQADRILANRFYRNIAGSLSGTQEYMASEALHQLHGDSRFDLVIVDTPPSRNALDFLEAPGVLSRFLDHRVFRILMLPARRGFQVLNTAAQPLLRAIGKVVGSDVLADAVSFFQAFSGMEAGFRSRAEEVIALLGAPGTRFVLVASPRHDTITEAVWFAEQLTAQGLGVSAAVVNRAHPVFGTGTAAEASARAISAADPAVAALWENLAGLRRISESEAAELTPLVDQMRGAPIAMVPLLASDVHDLDGLRQIGRHLFA
jgi:anion-transporting  ArsA/GET3 family ATPase